MTFRKRVFILCVLCSVHLACKGDALSLVEENIDMATIKRDPYTKFILRGIWPKQEVLATRMCDKNLIENDIAALSNTLARVLLDECLPTSQQVHSAIGIPDYNQDEDCLFLRYTTKSGTHVEVQNGEGLFILMSSPNYESHALADIKAFVRAYAVASIRYPQQGGVEENPIIFVSSLDIGNSKCGTITWKHKGENDLPFTDFYSRMMWWSDGGRILFAMSNMPKSEYARLATVANRAGQRKPHKFQYREIMESVRNQPAEPSKSKHSP